MAKTAAQQAEQTELDMIAKLSADLEKQKAKNKDGGKGKSKSKSGGKGKSSSMVKVGDTKVKKSELRELAEKGLAIQNAKKREAERNAEGRADMKKFREIGIVAGGTSAFASWLSKRTNFYKAIQFSDKMKPENQEAATDAAATLGLFYLAEEAKTYKKAKYYMSAALAMACKLGSGLGANFEGLDKFANKIDDKLKQEHRVVAK